MECGALKSTGLPKASKTLISEREVFWGEIAPTEHLVHLYSTDAAFLDMLVGFVSGGLTIGESVIVIGTDAHTFALNERLTALGFDLPKLREIDRYLDLNAEACLATFMVKGWPDREKFKGVITRLIERATKKGRRVRAFGEMVAILWEQGHCGATVQLEHMWNEIRESLPFPLFCSYPRAGFPQESEESLREICETHTKVIWNKTG